MNEGMCEEEPGVWKVGLGGGLGWEKKRRARSAILLPVFSFRKRQRGMESMLSAFKFGDSKP